MAYNSYGPQVPFWDSNQTGNAPGAGVDHTTPPAAFPFGGEGAAAAAAAAFQHPWAGRGRWGWGGPRGGGGGWGRRGGHRHGRWDQDHSCHRCGGSGDDTGDDNDGAGRATDAEGHAVGEDVPMMGEHERDISETVRNTPATAPAGEHPDPPEGVPDSPPHHRRHGPGFRGRRGGGGRGHGHHHHHHGPAPYYGPGHHGPGPHQGPGPQGHGFPWNFGPMMQAVGDGLRDYIDRARGGTQDEGADDSFAPPVDVFRTPAGWVLHIALPGTRKEDVGLQWDADRAVISVSGVVHRPGDEDFLAGLVTSERRIGLFTRDVKLPPAGAAAQTSERGEKDEVDAEGISARMEDGVLIVHVPLVEREWTEVRKVDIQ